MTTVGIPNYFRSYKLSDGTVVNVHIMDTSGQELFRAINEHYYKKADCCLLVYDISNRKSFEEMKYYNEQMKERCKANIKAILLGNKADLENKRQVPSEEAAQYSMINDYIFMETSCLENKNVADAFTTLIEITNIELKKNGIENSSLKLKRTFTKIGKSKKKCICNSEN